MPHDELMRLSVIIDSNAQAVVQQLGQVEQAGRRLAGVLAPVAQTAAGVFAGLAGYEGFRRALLAIADTAIGMNARLEQSRIAFANMLGSAEAAEKMLRGLQEFAAKTPFEFPELQDAARRMLALGFSAEEILPVLQAVGDAAAGLGLGAQGVDRIILALGQMQAKAKVTGEEMRQLTEAGIPAWEILAQAIGTTTQKVMELAEKGAIPADRAIAVLVEGMRRRFGGMMEEQSRSWTGLLSTIRDNVRLLIQRITEGMFERGKAVIQWVKDLTDRLLEAYQRAGFRGVLEELVPPNLQQALERAVDAARRLAESFSRLAQAVGPTLGEAFRGLLELAAPLASVVGLLARSLAFVHDAVRPLVPALVGLGAALAGLRIATAAWAAIQGLAAAMRTLQTTLAGVQLGTVAVGGALAGLPGAAFLAVSAVATLVTAWLSLRSAQDEVRDSVEARLRQHDREIAQQQAAYEAIRASVNTLEEQARVYVELKQQLESKSLTEAKATEIKLKLAEAEQQLIASLGDRRRAEIEAGGAIEKVAQAEIDARKAAMEAALKAVNAAKEAKRQQVLEEIRATQKEIETLKTSTEAWRQYLTWWEKIKAWWYGTLAQVPPGREALAEQLAGLPEGAIQRARRALAELQEIGRQRGLDQLQDRLDQLGSELSRLNAELEKPSIDRYVPKLKGFSSATEDAAEKAKKLAEEQKRVLQAMAEDYSGWIRRALDALSDEYESRLRQIEDATEAAIAPLRQQIEALEAEAEAEQRLRAAEEHERRLQELREQRRYHEIRTGKEHQKAIAEIDKQIAEEQRRWEEQQAEWQRQDRREELQRQIEDIQKNAEQQRRILADHYAKARKIAESGIADTLGMLAAKEPEFYQVGLRLANALVSGMVSGDWAAVTELVDQITRAAVEANLPPPGRAPTAVVPSGKYELAGERAIMWSRELAQMLGVDIEWDEARRMVRIGGKWFKPARIEEGKSYVYVREVAEALGRQVVWDEETKSIRIYHEGGYVPETGLAYLRAGELVLPPRTVAEFSLAAASIQRVGGLVETMLARPAGLRPSVEVRIDRVLEVHQMDLADGLDAEVLGGEMARALQLTLRRVRYAAAPVF
ncbi:MAG: tape measure protein [Firmicutes bacterium]|nr:tape measure protein [Bacillota bacterium]